MIKENEVNKDLQILNVDNYNKVIYLRKWRKERFFFKGKQIFIFFWKKLIEKTNYLFH